MSKIFQFFARKSTLNALKLILILALLAGFFYYVPLTNILITIRSASLPILFGVLAVSMVSVYITSIELWIFTRKQGIAAPVGQLFLMNLGIRFYSFFSPFSSIGSLMRWQKISIDGKTAEGLVAIAANRAIDIIVAIGVGLFWAITALNQDMINIPLIFAYLILFLLALWLMMHISSPIIKWAEQKEAVSLHPFIAKTYRLLIKFFKSLSVYRSFSANELFILILTTLIGELISLLIYVLLAISINIPISMANLGWMRTLIFLAALAPFTLAGGFGLREISVVVLMTGMGIGASQAAAFSILIYARNMAISLVGGILELFLFFFEKDRRLQ